MTAFQPGDVTDPRAYLADVLAKADAVDEFQGAWEMHAPRHPAPPVSEGDALAKAFADYESTREDVARRTDPMRANSLLLAGAGLANAVKDHLAQLQVQALVGEGLENSVSDGEREGLLDFLTYLPAGVTDEGQEIPLLHMIPASARECLRDALIAAGYRKPTLPSVDIDAAWEAHLPVVAPYHVEPLAKYDANAVARGVAYEKGFRAGATAIKAHLLDGGDRG